MARKKIQLTDFQKNVITYIALGGVAYGVYLLIQNNKHKNATKGLDAWLRANNIPQRTYDKVESFASYICDPNLFVYPTEISALITTMNAQELQDFHLVYDKFFKGGLCDNLTPRELLEDEWGNYYQNTEEFLKNNGY